MGVEPVDLVVGLAFLDEPVFELVGEAPLLELELSSRLDACAGGQLWCNSSETSLGESIGPNSEAVGNLFISDGVEVSKSVSPNFDSVGNFCVDSGDDFKCLDELVSPNPISLLDAKVLFA